VLLATAETKEEVKAAPKAAAEKKAPPAKAPVKPLPQMMEEDVIPSLKAILEAQQDLSDLQLVFQDNKVSNVAMLFKVLGLCDFREGKSPRLSLYLSHILLSLILTIISLSSFSHIIHSKIH
jgi:ribosome assembly protein YihI (activator of Der GTPase)